MKPVLFDVDGTLIDSAPIITQCFAKAMKDHAGIDRAPETYLKYVGPPLSVTFSDLGQDVAEMTRLYRENYVKVMMESPLFPGIAELLERLKNAGVPMVVATSKPTQTAIDVLENAGILSYFSAVCGASMTETNGSKAARVAEAMEKLQTAGIDASDALMVGDRIYDIEGAAANGLRCVLVRWGDAEESEHAQAWRSVSTMEELEALILAN